MTFEEVRWVEVWGSVWLPEAVATLVVTLYVFGKLQIVAKRFKF
jgi:hypothetical protein